MKFLTLLPLILIVIVIQFQNCGEAPLPANYHEILLKTQTRIEEIVANDYCESDERCKSLAYGSRPCGGPNSYIVHSMDANWNELESLVIQFNQVQYQMNIDQNAVGTCNIILEPSNLRCANNKCVAQ